MFDTAGSSTHIDQTFVMNHREDVAIFAEREKIIQTVADCPVVIIKGQTGCGKVCGHGREVEGG